MGKRKLSGEDRKAWDLAGALDAAALVEHVARWVLAGDQSKRVNRERARRRLQSLMLKIDAPGWTDNTKEARAARARDMLDQRQYRKDEPILFGKRPPEEEEQERWLEEIEGARIRKSRIKR